MATSYSPQHNGVEECKNQKIVDMARSMLKSKSLPNIFWAEALARYFYLLNICRTTSVQNMTLYQAWSGRKPGVSHLNVFG